MTHRVLTGAAAVWVAGFVLVYLAVIGSQGGTPSWWFVGLLAIAMAVLGFEAARGPNRLRVVAALVVLLFALVVSLLTIGVILLPAVTAVAVALVRQPAPLYES